jgi:hypothetical protein
MALKLTKAEAERQTALVADLQAQKDAMQKAIEDFNTALETARADLREAVGKYNDVVSEVNGFAADIASRLDDEINNKSEKWQEGEKGEAATAWKDEWEAIDFSELDVDELAPSDIDDFDDDSAETLEGISTEPEGSY